MTLRYVSSAARGEYDVFDGSTFLGTVRRRSERYNLRRPVTVHSWRAWPVGAAPDRTSYRTRADAAAALPNPPAVT